MPLVDSTVCHNATRMFEAREPVHGIDLVNHPLAGNTRGVWHEETVLDVLARVPVRLWPVHQVAFPVGILLADLHYELRPAPAAGLVDVPGHLDHVNIPKLT